MLRARLLLEGRYRINSAVARRILYRALSQINPADDKFQPRYVVKVSDIADVAGLKMNKAYYPRVLEAIKTLQSQVAEIWNTEAKRYSVRSWFHGIDYNYGKGTIDVVFHEDMKPVLLSLVQTGRYTAADEKYLAILKSPYSDRIYGLLKQYQTVGYRVMTVRETREKLLLEKKYPVFADFRRYVLDFAKKELGTKTDISFDYELIKKGRKADAIRFNIFSKMPEVTFENREEIDNKARSIFQRLVKLDVKEKVARELIADYDDSRLLWHINEYEKKLKKKKVEGIGWLINGIKEDYRPQRNIFEKQEEEKRRKTKKEREKREAINREIERLKGECAKHNMKAKMDIVSGLSETERADLDKEFQEKNRHFGRALGGLDITKIDESAAAKALFLSFIHEKYPDVGMSIEEYAKQNGAKREVLDALPHND